MKKNIFFLFLLGLFFFPTLNIEADSLLAPNSKSAILIDENTGSILFEKNKDIKLSPASMTKVMTLTLICDAIKEEKISLNTEITASSNASRMTGSRVYLNCGEKMILNDCLKSICIASANDCAVAVAEHLYGSEALFVQKMNEKVEELGLKNTHFNDCTGLSNDDHYTSSYDMAMISRNLLLNYKDIILPFTSTYDDYIRKDTDNPFWLVNTNKLIGKVDGIDGLKTGWTVKAGYCLAATMKKGNMRLISVVMGYSDSKTRNSETVSLLNYGFTNYEVKIILPKGKKIYHVNAMKYRPEAFDVVTLENLSILTKKGEKIKDISWNIKSYPNFKTGENGCIEVYYDDKFVGDIDIYAQDDVKHKSFFSIIIDIFLLILS